MRAIPTDALVGVVFSRPRPRSVVVERLAAFAVDAGRVVTTLARQLVPVRRRRRAPVPRPTRPSTARRPAAAARQRVDWHARRRVPVTLAPATDRHVRQRVVTCNGVRRKWVKVNRALTEQPYCRSYCIG